MNKYHVDRGRVKDTKPTTPYEQWISRLTRWVPQFEGSIRNFIGVHMSRYYKVEIIERWQVNDLGLKIPCKRWAPQIEKLIRNFIKTQWEICPPDQRVNIWRYTPSADRPPFVSHSADLNTDGIFTPTLAKLVPKDLQHNFISHLLPYTRYKSFQEIPIIIHGILYLTTDNLGFWYRKQSISVPFSHLLIARPTGLVNYHILRPI